MNAVLRIVILGILALAVLASPAANMTPVQVTGFNRDVVIESTASGPTFYGYAEDFNPGEANAFYESGLPAYNYGLPSSRKFISAVGDGTEFEFRPYTENNALVLHTSTTLAGTLTLVTPAPYKRIAILAASGSGGSSATVTLHFANGLSAVTSYNAPDWFNNSGFAIQGFERINPGTGGTSGAPSNPRFYQTTLDIEAITGTSAPVLTSLTFERASANATGVLGISGEIAGQLPVSITLQPVSQTLSEGAEAVFTAAASGVPTPAFQWYRSGAPVLSATNAILRMSRVRTNDNAAIFQMVARNTVSNVTHSVTSLAAVLTVVPDMTSPILLRARALGLSQIELFFNEPLDPNTVATVSNYKVTGPNGLVSVSSAATGAFSTNIVLSVGSLIQNAYYTAEVSGIADLAAASNTVAPQSKASFYALPYVPQEIGNSTPLGGAVPVGNGLDVSGGGSQVGGSADQFHFSSRERTGDFDIKVRLESLSLTDPWAEAGLMARANLQPGSETAAILATPSISGSYFVWRASAGAALIRSGSSPVNYPATWLRLQRSGNVFTGYAGRDGQAWAQLGSATIPMPATLFLGFAVSSRNTDMVATAAFRDLGDVSGTPAISSTVSREPLAQSSRRTPLVISEIMYNPPDVVLANRNARLEFVEIFNSLAESQDLAGFRLSGDVDYVFPAGTVLPGGAFIVVARSPSDLAQVCGPGNYVGPWLGAETNGLPNNAGTIRLRHRTGAVLLETEYTDEPPWPVAADGAGHSLVLAKPSYGENNPLGWAQSDRVLGSPGRIDGVTTDPADSVVINEILAHTDLPLVDYIELYNHGNSPVSIAGCVITDDASTNKFVVPADTTIAARGFIQFSETTLGFGLSAAGETIFFKNPSQSRMLDTLRFGGQENGVSYGRWPDGAGDFYRLSNRTSGQPNARVLQSDVLISEIMYNPISGDDDFQYVEIFNRRASAVDLGGWRLEGGVRFTFPSNTVCAANSYLVVARNAARLLTNYAQLNVANCFGDFAGALSGRGERIALSMPDTIVSTNSAGIVNATLIHIPVDEVTYGTGGEWGQWADGGGSSLELKDTRSNRRLAMNWADSDESSKASWSLVEHRGIVDNGTSAADQLQVLLLGEGECLIDNVEVLNSSGVNLIANSTFETSELGWVAEGAMSSSSWENAQGYNSTRSYRIRAVSRGDNQINRVRVPLTSGLASGSAATLRARVRWLKGHPEVVLRLRGNWLEAPGPLTTPSNPGTPAQPNSRAVANTGPAIYETAHSPTLPAAGQPITVSARVHDPDNVSSLALLYRLDPASTYNAVPMLDSGSGGDAVAGDGLFTATIPGQASGALVAYYIQAADSAPNPVSSRFPSGAPVNECLVKFGEITPAGNFPVYRIWMSQATFDRWSGRRKLDNSPNLVTFVLGDQRVIHSALAKFAGSPYISGGFNTPSGNRCGYSIDFPKDTPFLGSTALVLDWPGGHGNETTAIQEQMAYWMADKMNLPYSHRHFIRLFVNGISDQQRLLTYEAVLQPSGEFLAQWSPGDEDGDFFKIDRAFEFSDGGSLIADPMPRLQLYTTPNLATGGTIKDVEKYRWTWLKRSYDSALNYGSLMAVVDALNSPGPEPYTSQTEGLVDIDNWMGIFAFSHIINNFDSWGHVIGKNMYMYKPRYGKWQIYAFDLDWLMLVSPQFSSAYTATGTALFDCDDPTVTRMYNHPPFRRAYMQAVRDAVNGPLVSANCDPVMDAKYASLLANGIAYCDTRPLTSPAAVKTWFAQRKTTLQGILNSQDAPLALTSPSTLNVSTNLVMLTGTAPVGLETILVNGVPWKITWTSLTGWALRMPVNIGTTLLTLIALDGSGQVLGTLSTTVVYQGQHPLASDSLVISEIMAAPKVPRGEYVELLNTSSTAAFDLSNWRFDGLSYTFPSGSYVAPSQSLLLARDRTAIVTEHGSNVVAFDVFDGDLQPGGETLTLLRPADQGSQPVAIVKYRNGRGWPEAPAGSGRAWQLRQASQDNWRPANWATTVSGTPSEPRWIFVSSNITVSSTTFYLYLGSPGQVYVDDIRLRQGAGPNLIGNGDFESPLSSSWTVAPNFSGSSIDRNVKRIGNSSLRLVTTGAGTGSGNSISQTIAGLAPGSYTLSFYYLQTTNGSPLSVRFSGGSGITLNPAPPVENLAAATPGSANSVIGSMASFPSVWLNEVQPENLSGITNSTGQRAPWIELFNPTTNAVSLEGLFLSTHETNLLAWPFPQGASMPPRSFKVVFADALTNLTTPSEWHASFIPTLRAGDVFLSQQTTNAQIQVLDILSYTNTAANRAFGSIPDAQSFLQRELFFATPGSSNNPASSAITVAINEWMSDNTGILADPADAGFEDWFELFNYGTLPVDLGGFYLTDNLTNRFQFPIPANGHYIIPPKGFLLVWADSEPAQNSIDRPDLHVSFALSKSGEAIGLFGADGAAVDYITFGAQAQDSSGGRYPDGGTSYSALPVPTPRKSNAGPNTAPVLPELPMQFVYVGQALNLYLAATDPESPPQTLTYSVDPGSPAGLQVAPASGLITWSPGPAQVGTHVFTARVQDDGVPSLTATSVINVTVQPPPQITSSFLPGSLTLSWFGYAGRMYRLEYKPSLDSPDWYPAGQTVPGMGAPLNMQISTTDAPSGFYRMVVLP